MARKLDDIMAALPAKRRVQINDRAMELATLKDLRKAAEQTQENLALELGVGQDTISRLEKRSDMLLSTLRHYVECMGGKLELVAQFPNRPPVIIDHLGVERSSIPKRTSKTSRIRNRSDRASA
jgi:DNA-binding XRE family transcriptional regulator